MSDQTAPGQAGTRQRLLIRADGAARGNPGPAAAGAVLIDATRPDTAHPDAPPLAVIARPLGVQTNNVAEYTAVKLALERALQFGTREVELVLDSKLIVEQLSGRWRVREPGMIRLSAEVRELLGRFAHWSIRHEPRAANRAADALANLALDDPEAAAAAERWNGATDRPPPSPGTVAPPEADLDPAGVVRRWFDAWAAADMSAARRLFAAAATFHAPGGSSEDIQGFDDVVAWFAERRAREGKAFDYQVRSISGGDRFAAAFLALSAVRSGQRIEWEQVALYRIEQGVIAEAWAFEADPQKPPSPRNWADLANTRSRGSRQQT